MLKEPIDIIFGGLPWAGYTRDPGHARFIGAPKYDMRELTPAEVDQVHSAPVPRTPCLPDFTPFVRLGDLSKEWLDSVRPL